MMTKNRMILATAGVVVVAVIAYARLLLWTRRLLVDARSQEPGPAVTGDIVSLELIRDRIAHTLRSSDARQLDSHLRELRVATEANEFSKATEAAHRLLALLERLQP